MPNGHEQERDPVMSGSYETNISSLFQRLEIAERDIGTLRDKIARLAEREGCDDCHNHMPGLNRSRQQFPNRRNEP